jgi:hypothetical protein
VANLVPASDLLVYLGIPTIDTTRADMLLGDAEALCSSIVTPLPAGAAAIIKAAAAQAYVNPTFVTSENVGPIGYSRPAGLYLSKAQTVALKRMAGMGGAFSIDPTPADAGTGLPSWDINVTYLEGVPVLDDRTAGGV